MVRQLQRDVDMTEQSSLQVLEDGAAPDGDDAALDDRWTLWLGLGLGFRHLSVVSTVAVCL